MHSLEYQTTHAFTAPPYEWIAHRLENLRQTLNQNTSLSAEALKGLLGSIHLEPKFEKDPDVCHIGEFKPYYIAHTKIKTLALLDDKYKGSNCYQWRRERDLNPRNALTFTRFPVVLLQPLGHLSEDILYTTLSLFYSRQ
jgi:hypothetical protein